MIAVPINFYAEILNVVIAMGMGYLWYNVIFEKQWIAMMGFTKDTMPAKRKNMGMLFGLQALGALIMSFVLTHDLVFGSQYLGISGVEAGLQAGFWNWLGFVVPVSMGIVLWDGKPWKLWAINAGYYLVVLLIMGVVLATWM